MRTPKALKQLVSEVGEHYPDAKPKIVGEPDGFGYHREVEFDAKTSKRLAPVLTLMSMEDARLVEVDDSGSRLRVVIAADHRADFDGRFDLADVARVLEDEPESQPVESDES